MAVLAALTASAVPAAAQTSPNLVIVFADDLGYGDLGVTGHPSIRTPRLDRMAAEGMRLTTFYVAAPSCSPSRAALLTGRYPIRTGVNYALGPESPVFLPDSEVTLAELLRERGYRTALVGKWHLGSTPGHLPLDHGFDRYFGLPYSNDMIPPYVQTSRPLELYRDRSPVERVADQSDLTVRYTEEAVRFIRENRDRPFFLYLAHSMPHVPLSVPAAFQGRSAAGRYGDVVELLDWSTGQVLDALAEEGLDGRTLVIFTSDNGPWAEMPARMFTDGTVVPWDAGSAGPFRGSKATTYEGGVRVPFIARWPGRIPASQVRGDVVTAMDLFPTLAAMAGAPLPAGRTLDGRDASTLLQGGAAPPFDLLYYFNDGRLEAVRDSVWKLRVTGTAEAPLLELFHLGRDPYERHNMAGAEPATTARLMGLLQTMARETGARFPQPH